MAQTKLLIAFIFLAIILADKIQSTEGRNLKSKAKNEFHKISTRDSAVKFTRKSSDDCSTTAPPCGNEAVLMSPPVAPPPPPPSPGHADDFRPTTPGHSPGIGHSL